MMLSASKTKSNATAKTTVKMCKVLAMNDVHCDERHLQPRAFIGSISLPSAVTRTNTKQAKDLSASSPQAQRLFNKEQPCHQTTRSVERDDFVHHILSNAETAISFSARRDPAQTAH